MIVETLCKQFVALGHEVVLAIETPVMAEMPFATELARHQVMVTPSHYEEPFGIVALKELACGCLPLVSERGGLPEAIGNHGSTFPNGDADALAGRLQEILGDMARAPRRG